MSDSSSAHPPPLTPFEKFEVLAKRLFAVPKHELDEEIAKDEAERKRCKNCPPDVTETEEPGEQPQ